MTEILGEYFQDGTAPIIYEKQYVLAMVFAEAGTEGATSNDKVSYEQHLLLQATVPLAQWAYVVARQRSNAAFRWSRRGSPADKRYDQVINYTRLFDVIYEGYYGTFPQTPDSTTQGSEPLWKDIMQIAPDFATNPGKYIPPSGSSETFNTPQWSLKSLNNMIVPDTDGQTYAQISDDPSGEYFYNKHFFTQRLLASALYTEMAVKGWSRISGLSTGSYTWDYLDNLYSRQNPHAPVNHKPAVDHGPASAMTEAAYAAKTTANPYPMEFIGNSSGEPTPWAERINVNHDYYYRLLSNQPPLFVPENGIAASAWSAYQ